MFTPVPEEMQAIFSEHAGVKKAWLQKLCPQT